VATQADYFALDREMGRIYDRISETTDGHERARLLIDAYETEGAMATMHREVFGPDPLPDEPGRDLADALASSAVLLSLLADVELVACGDLTRRFTTDTWLEPHAGPVLDRMAATGTAEERAGLLEDLFDAVVPQVGGQAAEVLACIPLAPGLRGWDGGLYLPSSFPKLVRVLWRARRAVR
jgi:hypothetical protein